MKYLIINDVEYEIVSDTAEKLVLTGALLFQNDESYILNPDHLFTCEEVKLLMISD